MSNNVALPSTSDIPIHPHIHPRDTSRLDPLSRWRARPRSSSVSWRSTWPRSCRTTSRTERDMGVCGVPCQTRNGGYAVVLFASFLNHFFWKTSIIFYNILEYLKIIINIYNTLNLEPTSSDIFWRRDWETVMLHTAKRRMWVRRGEWDGYMASVFWLQYVPYACHIGHIPVFLCRSELWSLSNSIHFNPTQNASYW